jgi:hypothetical protein
MHACMLSLLLLLFVFYFGLLHRFGHSNSLATLASWPSNEGIAAQDYTKGVRESVWWEWNGMEWNGMEILAEQTPAVKVLTYFLSAIVLTSLLFIPSFLPSFCFIHLFHSFVSLHLQIIAFCVFLCLLFCVWGLILIVLTLNYGVNRVGCAAGGELVDVGALRQAKVSRAERKRRIVRAWRLQSMFLLASLLLPTFSFLLVNRGLTPFVASLDGLVDVNDQVDSKAFRGIELADSMTTLYRDLKAIPIVDIQSFCPNGNAIDTNADDLLDGLGMYELSETIQSGLATVDSFLMNYLTDIRPGLVQVTDATRMLDRGIESVYDSDWFLKLFLVALNVVNGFFIFGVFLSKISVVYTAFQAMLQYLLLPLFCLLLLGSIAATCAAISMSLANAGTYERIVEFFFLLDWSYLIIFSSSCLSPPLVFPSFSLKDFCAGGSLPGSPLGTIRDMVAEYGYPEDSLAYRSVAYYTHVRIAIVSCRVVYYRFVSTRSFLLSVVADMYAHSPSLFHLDRAVWKTTRLLLSPTLSPRWARHPK